MGWPADPDGTIPTFPRDTGDGLEPVQINVNQFTSEPTTRIALGVNLPATETEFGTAGDTLELSVEYFDNLGTSQSINIEFTPTVPGAPGASNECDGGGGGGRRGGRGERGNSNKLSSIIVSSRRRRRRRWRKRRRKRGWERKSGEETRGKGGEGGKEAYEKKEEEIQTK